MLSDGTTERKKEGLLRTVFPQTQVQYCTSTVLFTVLYVVKPGETVQVPSKAECLRQHRLYGTVNITVMYVYSLVYLVGYRHGTVYPCSSSQTAVPDGHKSTL